MKILLRIIVGIILIVAVTAFSLNFYLRSKLPDYDGSRQLEGLQKPVEVYFDNYAIPHIYAQTEEDAYYALGFTHAQERLFQMDLMRRVGKGELSTMMGKATVDTDKFFRTLGLHHIARHLADKYLQDPNDPFTKAFMAYLKGVNAYVDTGKGSVEHLLLQAEIKHFTPSDIYAIGGVLGVGFAEGFRTEPIVEHIRQLGEDYVKTLVLTTRAEEENIHTYQPADSALLQATNKSILQALNALPVPLWMGSNGWAIAPSRTSAGKAILANDTHMGYSQPSVWFEAHLEYPGHIFAGLHAAGIPFGLIGRNRQIAWGLTMFENDDTDFFKEKINPENPLEVWHEGAWMPIKQRQEKIEVKDGEAQIIEVRETPNGPIISDLAESSWAKLSQEPVSLWWAFANTDIRSFQGWYHLAKASNLAEAQECVRLMDAPGLNVMYADVEGNIAWWAAARLFERPAHVNSFYLLNGEGSDSPLPFVDFSKNPKAINPPWGYVYSANNQPDSLQGLYVPGYYFSDQRAKTITDLLQADNSWDVPKVRAMQLSTQSRRKQELVLSMLALLSDEAHPSGVAKQAYEVLRVWRGTHELEDTAPAIYYKFQYYLIKGMMEDELGKEVSEAFMKSNIFLHSIPKLFADKEGIWWDDKVTADQKETAQQIADRAYFLAIEELVERRGNDMKNWQWGKMHVIKHPHALSSVAWLDKLFSIAPTGIAGGREVINNIGLNLTDKERYLATYGPAMRFIVDFSDVDHAWNILPTGQSGHVLSKHYRDQAGMYNAGEQRLQCINKEEIIEGAMGKLVLSP